MKKWILLIVFSTLVFVVARPIFAQETILLAPNSDGVLTATVKTEEQKNLEDGTVAAQNGQPNLWDTSKQIFQAAAATTSLYVGTGSEKAGIQGALPSMGKAIAFLYQERPAETGVFVADLIHSANIAPPAYAQGLGFASLNPILATWKVFRNLAYLFYVIVFLFVGFMIMFRQKIGSQAVVTAQQALPSIVISLIAVTFSYAIAGLLIDAMYLFMFLLTAIFTPQLSNIKNLTLDRNIFDIGLQLLTSGSLGTVHEAVNKMISNIVGAGPDGQTITGWIGGLTFAIIFGFMLLLSIFKTFMELLKSYIAIIIGVVVSPLVLAFSLPGKSTFPGWFKGLIGNLVVFPTVLICLILAFMIQSNISGESGGGFLPPYLIQGATPQTISTIFAIGILIVMPEIVAKVRDAVGGPDPFAWFSKAFEDRFKRGAPAGSRIGLGLTGGGLGAAAGAAYYGVKGGFRPGAFATGASIGGQWGAKGGISGAARISRASGWNQPDIFSTFTDPMDKWADPKEAERQRRIRFFEDQLQNYESTRGAPPSSK